MPISMQGEHVLRFTAPTCRFDEALPIGNGRLGAMVYGQVAEERLLLNESGMWSGSPEQADREGAWRRLAEIRKLLAEGENKKAEELFHASFTCTGQGTAHGSGAAAPFGCYQMLGFLTMHFFNRLSFSHQNFDHMDEYVRELDISRAVAGVRFPGGGVRYSREYLCSAPDQAIAIRLSADRPGQVNVGLGLDRPERRTVEAVSPDELVMRGALDDGYVGEGVRYACAVKVVAKGGEVYAECGRVYVKGADEALIVIAASTSLSGFPGGRGAADPEALALDEARAAVGKGWDALLAAHVEDFQSYFGRMDLAFEKGESRSALDLAGRMRDAEARFDDPGLAELHFHYARYLLISCSRPGGMPANLQGLWAEEVQTPWNGDWHLNAQQMIYWAAERANLSECHTPYLELTRSLVAPGQRTARAYYNSDGWVAHTCTNPWGFTSPCEEALWGSTLGSGAWLCHHLWEHYLFTGDLGYLRGVYPVLCGAARFYRDILAEDPETGLLVTSPSSSPENAFFTDKGETCALCMGPSYDTQLVRSLFSYCVEAQRLLGEDPAFARELAGLLNRMADIEIGSDGRVKEWLKEYREPYPFHRHVSHLWGAYPGRLISREKTPELAEAAERSLIARGKTTAGWATAYRLCLWARLRRGERAFQCLGDALKNATAFNLFNLAYHCDETLPEPLSPAIGRGFYPFQIDGNMGVASGILMMLADDRVEDGHTVIDLLPALPEALPGGILRGASAPGGFELDLTWRDMRPVEAAVRAKKSGTCLLRFGGTLRVLTFEAPGEQRVRF
jgi:alpha-L-fucosidase 2